MICICEIVFRRKCIQIVSSEFGRGELEGLLRQWHCLVNFAAVPISIHELRGWDEVKLLTVRVNRLDQWFRPGLLCIGDAAHAMSPVGGVGINLAIQDAVAAANVLFKPLQDRQVTIDDLRRIQTRREFPTRLTQKLQLATQDRIIAPLLTEAQSLKPPLAVRLLGKLPLLRRIPARVIGLGIRPEHVSAALLRAYVGARQL